MRLGEATAGSSSVGDVPKRDMFGVGSRLRLDSAVGNVNGKAPGSD